MGVWGFDRARLRHRHACRVSCGRYPELSSAFAQGKRSLRSNHEGRYDGTTLEIKATTHKYARKGKTPYYRWKVSTQSEALKGNREIADYWLFLIASFPRETSRTPRVVQAFDTKNWMCYVVSGEKLRTAGCTRYVSESTLRRLGVEPFSLGELKKKFNHEIH